MEQFSLEKYLENTSRKVVTRRGNPVRIICTDRKHGEDESPVVFLEEINGGEMLLTCKSDGRSDNNYDTQYDLFFADDELTEFEKALSEFIQKLTFNGNVLPSKDIKGYAKSLLGLARKELRKGQQEKLGTLEMPIDVTEPYYIQGKQDALKDLPKWKKCTGSTGPFIDYNAKGEEYLYLKDYVIKISELEKLPKEE